MRAKGFYVVTTNDCRHIMCRQRQHVIRVHPNGAMMKHLGVGVQRGQPSSPDLSDKTTAGGGSTLKRHVML